MIPLSLYIHTPWCVQKCPYCDFNSHGTAGQAIPEAIYIQRLIEELSHKARSLSHRHLHSIFIGGGTPSLIAPQHYATLFRSIKEQFSLPQHAEITLEANPGTVDQRFFEGYREIGINRLSLGIQSFSPNHLKCLGRIHDDTQAKKAIEIALKTGFNSVNIDLMFGLPQQTIQEALLDLETALSFETPHLSWYQLTLEPHTAFFHSPPTLPDDEETWEMQCRGETLLQKHHYEHYEISAYAKAGFQCRHNLNYWQYGDYLGIGAGAHSKLTLSTSPLQIERHWNIKHPKNYLDPEQPWIANRMPIRAEEIPSEFMMNALRLYESIPFSLIEERTNLTKQDMIQPLTQAVNKGLIQLTEKELTVTPLGHQFLNDLVAYFLPTKTVASGSLTR